MASKEELWEQMDRVLERLETCVSWPWTTRNLETAARQDARYRKGLGLPPLKPRGDLPDGS